MFTFAMAEPRTAPLAALPSTLFHVALVSGALWATRSVAGVIADPPVDPTDLVWITPVVHHTVPFTIPGAPILHTSVDQGITIPEVPVIGPLTPGMPTIDPTTLTSPVGTPGLDPVGAIIGSAGTIYQESEVDDPPTLLIAATPRYPRVMAEAGIDGRVTLTFVIDTLGHVSPGSVKAEGATHPAFIAAAEEAAYATTFRPAHRHGVAVAVRVRQGMVFRH